MNLWERFLIERENYYFLNMVIDIEATHAYRVEYSYMYFDEESFGEDEFYHYLSFETLEKAIEFKELMKKVKILDIPRLNEDTYLVGDVKIYKVVFETRELIM